MIKTNYDYIVNKGVADSIKRQKTLVVVKEFQEEGLQLLMENQDLDLSEKQKANLFEMTPD